MKVHVERDRIAQLTYVQLREERVRSSMKIDNPIGYLVLNFDRDGRIVGLEFDDKHLPLSERL